MHYFTFRWVEGHLPVCSQSICRGYAVGCLGLGQCEHCIIGEKFEAGSWIKMGGRSIQIVEKEVTGQSQLPCGTPELTSCT